MSRRDLRNSFDNFFIEHNSCFYCLTFLSTMLHVGFHLHFATLWKWTTKFFFFFCLYLLRNYLVRTISHTTLTFEIKFLTSSHLRTRRLTSKILVNWVQFFPTWCLPPTETYFQWTFDFFLQKNKSWH